MAKPVIYKRNDEGRALTFTEVDTSLQNLKDATISVTDGTGTVVLDLNDTLTLAAGSGISYSVNAGTKTVEISTTESQNLFNQIATDDSTIVADGTTDTLTLSGGTAISVTGDAATDTITFTLDDTAVTAGSYTLTNITVDQQGRITDASSTEITGGNGISVTQDSLGQIVITNTLGSTDLTAADTIVVGQADSDTATITSNNTVSDKPLRLASRRSSGQGAYIEITEDISLRSDSIAGDIFIYGANVYVAGTPSTGFIDLGDTITRRGVFKDYAETVYAIGNSGSGTVTPDQVNGNVQTITATDNFTLALPSNMLTGGSMTIIITQDGTGSRTCTFNASYKFAGGAKTLSTGAGDIDIVSVFYDGTNYLASLSTDFN